jgi:hypothetical protein
MKKGMSDFFKSFTALTPFVSKSSPKPISFFSKVKKMNKVDVFAADKTNLIKIDFFMNPDNPAFMYSRHFAIFKYGQLDKKKGGVNG